MKIELERYIDSITNALIPRSKDLAALESSKDSGFEIEAEFSINYSTEIDKEGGTKAYIHANPSDEITDIIGGAEAGAEAGSSKTQSLGGDGIGTIRMKVYYNSDGKQGILSKLFRKS